METIKINDVEYVRKDQVQINCTNKDPEEHERRAIANCTRNQIAIDELHSAVFRTIIKHGTEEESKWAEYFWEKCRDHFDYD